jgi:hypothetical protein
LERVVAATPLRSVAPSGNLGATIAMELRFLPSVFVVALTALAFAQGGYSKEEHAELGITLPRARDYEQVPTQPDEDLIVLYYAEKLAKEPRDRRAVRPTLEVVWIDWTPDTPAPTTGGPVPT